MARQRKLYAPVSAMTWETSCDDNQVNIRSGKPDRQKTDTRRFETSEDALSWAEKQELARLKKGFVLVDAQAQPGEPSLLCYLDGGHTGAMTLTGMGDLILCNRYQADADEGRSGDALILIDVNARIHARLDLEGVGLIWNVQTTSGSGEVVLQTDSGIFSWVVGTAMPTLISERTEVAPGFVSVAGNLAAWHATGFLEVCEVGSRRTRMRRALASDLCHGHTPQMAGALSPDGRRLAVCAAPGTIQFMDIHDGEATTCHQGDFEMITRMHWTPDGRWIIALEQYGRWRLMCFDATSGEPRRDWTLQDDMSRSDFAISADGSRLAITHRGHLAIHDLRTMKQRHHVRLDHVVRLAWVAWMAPDKVCVRTDRGCVGTYIV